MGAEALLRWTHAERGPVSPAKFIPIAERSGLIHALGEWVLEQVAEMIMRRGGEGKPRLVVAVNLSITQLYDRSLADKLRTLVSRFAQDPRQLEVELTESILMEDFALAVDFLHAMRALGVESAIDDFGTGYSSLAYLKKLPIDYVKVDRAFIVDEHSDQDEQTLCSGILGLIRGLGLVAIAEGVETRSQLAWLEAHDCEQVQGFLFSPAVPEAELDAVIARIEQGA
jgi:EAL domain-containing protein (putative c-di-GMP-specific phosphodiesterase class I)